MAMIKNSFIFFSITLKMRNNFEDDKGEGKPSVMSILSSLKAYEATFIGRYERMSKLFIIFTFFFPIMTTCSLRKGKIYFIYSALNFPIMVIYGKQHDTNLYNLQ